MGIINTTWAKVVKLGPNELSSFILYYGFAVLLPGLLYFSLI